MGDFWPVSLAGLARFEGESVAGRFLHKIQLATHCGKQAIEIGGVRLEDVALVTGNGAKNLTRFEKVLEI